PNGGVYYWTATPSTTTASNYWRLGAAYGVTDFIVNSTSVTMYARCVSGTSMPASQFSATGSGVVTDRTTGLVWTQCSMDNSGTGTLRTSASGCSNLVEGTRTWDF